MDDDRIRWDARWRERGEGPGEPSALITALAPQLPTRGRALDIAGGAGRHALWLARRGLDVTLVDISEVALTIARAAPGPDVTENLGAASGLDAARRGRLHTLALDLEEAPLPPGPWDVILCFHYLQRSLFAAFPEALAPGGLLVIVHPTRTNLERHPRPSARFLLDDGELPGLLRGGLDVVRYEEGWLSEGRHEARLLARRP
ncbi:class I SAM-dependent methyltransferase [Chondromyces crocatus]|uniref:SAM-dependent methyltransferase n=1 Tax=Chondromyces crocatus TaxID=52 RepID=A0A0K1ES35_CHOCO|nr:class I SAM-dependent methyltransferase [Chondromyces crocatus]AKT43740.1 SAM-dependent methyltransferase [Chondromyces crocatus]